MYFLVILLLTIGKYSGEIGSHLIKEIHIGKNLLNSYVVENKKGELFIVVSHPFILECFDTSGEKLWSVYDAYSKCGFYPKGFTKTDYILAVRRLSKNLKVLLSIKLIDGKILDTTIIHSKYEDPYICFDYNMDFIIYLYRSIKDTPRYYFGKLSSNGKFKYINSSNISEGFDCKILPYNEDLIFFGSYSSLNFSYIKNSYISDLHPGVLLISLRTGKLINRYMLEYNFFSHINFVYHDSSRLVIAFYGSSLNPESFYGIESLSLPYLRIKKIYYKKGNFYPSETLISDSLMPFFNPDSNILSLINIKKLMIEKTIMIDSENIIKSKNWKIKFSKESNLFVNDINLDGIDDILIITYYRRIITDPRWSPLSDNKGRFVRKIKLFILYGPEFKEMRKILIPTMTSGKLISIYKYPLLFLNSSEQGVIQIIRLEDD